MKKTKLLDKLEFIPIKEKSGCEVDYNLFPIIKRKHTIVLNHFSLDGAAPKQVAKIYRYKQGVAQSRKRLPVYIIKTGHKWYPIESITEQLFTDIGECFDLKMAETFVAICSNQLKFFSKYFLKKNKKLVKGIEIYCEYLGGGKEDKKLIKEIEEGGYSRELITVEFTYDALKKKYPNNYQDIFNHYVKLLIFDALIGNNDRHFYNWGVIEKVSGSSDICKFSPIYDTARGLFWNITEKDLEKYENSPGKFEKYISQCTAKISYGGNKQENHFTLIKLIYDNRKTYNLLEEIFTDIINERRLEQTIEMIKEKYFFLSESRKTLIEKCLRIRKKLLEDSIKE